jgi:hypothetical protein
VESLNVQVAEPAVTGTAHNTAESDLKVTVPVEAPESLTLALNSSPCSSPRLSELIDAVSTTETGASVNAQFVSTAEQEPAAPQEIPTGKDDGEVSNATGELQADPSKSEEPNMPTAMHEAAEEQESDCRPVKLCDVFGVAQTPLE